MTQVLGIGSSFFYFLCLESYLSSLAVYPTFLVSREGLCVCILVVSPFLVQSWVWCHKHGPPQLVGLLYMVICGAKVVVSSVLVFWTSFSAPLTHFTALVAGLEHVYYSVCVFQVLFTSFCCSDSFDDEVLVFHQRECLQSIVSLAEW